jgi:hypothetical protein
MLHQGFVDKILRGYLLNDGSCVHELNRVYKGVRIRTFVSLLNTVKVLECLFVIRWVGKTWSPMCLNYVSLLSHLMFLSQPHLHESMYKSKEVVCDWFGKQWVIGVKNVELVHLYNMI